MRSFLVIVFLGLFSIQNVEAVRSKKHGLDDSERTKLIAATTPPKDNESCFAPDEECAAKLIRFIETAKSTLEIAIFEMTDRKIAEAIATASKIVKVRLVVNRKLVKDSGPCYEILRAAGVPIRAGHQRGIMHDKFTVVDGKRLETGSFNYTNAAGNSNQENQLYLSTPSVVARYQERFEKMWRDGKQY
jgi:cardiolipin hydrolase